jgi:hypothetical protein
VGRDKKQVTTEDTECTEKGNFKSSKVLFFSVVSVVSVISVSSVVNAFDFDLIASRDGPRCCNTLRDDLPG